MTCMRCISITLVCWLILPYAARADFQWVGLWQIDSQQGSVSFTPPADPNIVDWPVVTGNAFANTSSPSQVSSITFHRDFRILNQAPGTSFQLGYDMIISGSYTKLNSGFGGSVSASIQLDGVTLPGTASSTNFGLQTGGIPSPISVDGGAFGIMAPAGLHRITSTLFVSAGPSVPPPPPPPPAFISINPNADGNLTALQPQTVLPADLPVPEPSPVALFGMGLFGLGAAGSLGRRRRGRSDRS